MAWKDVLVRIKEQGDRKEEQMRTATTQTILIHSITSGAIFGVLLGFFGLAVGDSEPVQSYGLRGMIFAMLIFLGTLLQRELLNRKSRNKSGK